VVHTKKFSDSRQSSNFLVAGKNQCFGGAISVADMKINTYFS